LKDETLYEISGEIRSTHDVDGGTLLDISRGQIFRLNATGSRIFECLHLGQSESQIIDSISKDFDIARTSVQSDLTVFLQSLEQQGVIHHKPERRLP
jgi:Coenzyme PQQ synthesis protein D (PqqD)